MGPTGVQGATGRNGVTGTQGTNGVVGTQGPTGFIYTGYTGALAKRIYSATGAVGTESGGAGPSAPFVFTTSVASSNPFWVTSINFNLLFDSANEISLSNPVPVRQDLYAADSGGYWKITGNFYTGTQSYGNGIATVYYSYIM
jgi:hypothetical protein